MKIAQSTVAVAFAALLIALVHASVVPRAYAAGGDITWTWLHVRRLHFRKNAWHGCWVKQPVDNSTYEVAFGDAANPHA